MLAPVHGLEYIIFVRKMMFILVYEEVLPLLPRQLTVVVYSVYISICIELFLEKHSPESDYIYICMYMRIRSSQTNG